MLILGIITVIVGIFIFCWAIKGLNGSVFDRPAIFNSTVAVFIINFIWFGLLCVSFYCFWKVDPIIDVVIISIFIIIWLRGYYLGSEKTKAKKIFNIYKKIKLFHPKMSSKDILVEATRTYFLSLGFDNKEIEAAIEVIFEKGIDDVKKVASGILSFQNSWNLHSSSSEDLLKSWDKEAEAIDYAYNIVIGKDRKVVERPVLSKSTSDWVKSTGLNLDDMTNEQLEVFTEMDDHNKSSWVVKLFYKTAPIFLIIGFIELIRLEIIGVLLSLVAFVIIWFIGHKIQIRRVSKNFHEASVAGYAKQQANTN